MIARAVCCPHSAREIEFDRLDTRRMGRQGFGISSANFEISTEFRVGPNILGCLNQSILKSNVVGRAGDREIQQDEFPYAGHKVERINLILIVKPQNSFELIQE